MPILAAEVARIVEGQPWIEFDACTPVEKFEIIRGEKNGMQLAECLVALSAIDTAFRRHYPGSPFYVLGDESVISAIVGSRSSTITPKDHLPLVAAIRGLALAQLIYRFTVARRFHVADRRRKQLRINSWGRLLHRQRMWQSHRILRDAVEELIASEISRNRLAYDEVARLLKFDVDIKCARRVAEINNSLLVQVVA